MSITLYTFDINTAELMTVTRWERRVAGPHREVVRIHDRTRTCVGVSVKEGNHAWDEFKAWFGDDSSWPPGWWQRMQA